MTQIKNLNVLSYKYNLELMINTIISETLNIPCELVENGQLTYQSVKEWDSLSHIQLIMELEEKFDLVIDDTIMGSLTSISKIKKWIYEQKNIKMESDNSSDLLKNSQDSLNCIEDSTIYRGLNNLNFDKSKITFIDGKNGFLQYRGYSIGDLVEYSTYEEVSFLLLYGHLPNNEQLKLYNKQLIDSRSISPDILDIIYKLRNSHPMDMLRTVISYLSSQYDRNHKMNSNIHTNGIKLIAQIPIIVSIFHSMRTNGDYVEYNSQFNHTKNFLYMLNGNEPSDELVRSIEKSLILQADHGSNASTFTARVVTSTKADVFAAVTSALAAFSGALHGGAAENVMTMLEEIGSADNVSSYIQKLMIKNEPIMGFGHRIYRVEDPRVQHLYALAKEFSYKNKNNNYMEILDNINNEMKKYSKYGLNANVDLYMGVIYHMFNIPKDLLGPIFVISRISGWIAQIIEQVENNILIRPSLYYEGNMDLLYKELCDRD